MSVAMLFPSDCLPGSWGPDCTEACKEGCSSRCDVADGSCDYGCDLWWAGDNCDLHIGRRKMIWVPGDVYNSSLFLQKLN